MEDIISKVVRWPSRPAVKCPGQTNRIWPHTYSVCSNHNSDLFHNLSSEFWQG